MKETTFKLTKNGREVSVTNLTLVRLLKKLGWKVKHNTLSELI